jgi:hypothetical protein
MDGRNLRTVNLFGSGKWQKMECPPNFSSLLAPSHPRPGMDVGALGTRAFASVGRAPRGPVGPHFCVGSPLELEVKPAQTLH